VWVGKRYLCSGIVQTVSQRFVINPSGFHDDMNILWGAVLFMEPVDYNTGRIEIIFNLAGFYLAFNSFTQQAQIQSFLTDINT